MTGQQKKNPPQQHTRVFYRSDLRYLIKPKEVIQREDEEHTEIIQKYVEDWPQKYYERFQRWYVRRQEKHSAVQGKTFDDWSVVTFEDCIHHLKNWDHGLKKAMLKDKLIDNTRRVVRRIKYQEKRRNQKIRSNGKHPHENEQIKDTDYVLSAKMKELHVDPKTRQNIYVDVDEPGTEQGGFVMEYNNQKYSVQIPMPDDDEPILSHPFSHDEIDAIVNPYTNTSIFFMELLNRGERDIMINEYLASAQYLHGTPSYYRDLLFSTRRRRDELVEFINGFQIGVEQGDSGTSATDLETASSVSSTANITIVDERPVDTASLHTSGDIHTDDFNSDIAESNWTIGKVLTRECPIGDFAWSTSDAKKKIIVTGGLPKLITDEAECMITQQLKFFAFLRAGIRIRVQLNGTKFHCGRLLIYFKPLTWNDDKEDNFSCLTVYPHFWLDASVSNSGELFIPFTHLLTYFSQESQTLFNDSINSLGSMNIIIYNSLRADKEASQTIYGEYYLSLVEPHPHLPISGITTFSYGDGYLQGLEGVLKRAAGGLVSSGLGIADKFSGGLVTGLGNGICNLLGIRDKPIDPVGADPIVNRTVAPLCHGAGLDRSTRLALSPISQTDTPSQILGATDGDFNLRTLTEIPCLLEQPEWTSAQTQGHKLFDMLVTPTYISPSQLSLNAGQSLVNYEPTMLAYVSRAFCQWRGSLKVKIQIISTDFHSGRLMLVYDPHGNYNVNYTDLKRNKPHNIIIMDVQEQKELVVELPYFAVKPYLRCDHLRSSFNLSQNGAVDNKGYLDCDHAGVFRIFVLNPLVHPSNVTDKIEINLFFYSGDGFELAVVNSLAPLSVRKGPSGVQYGNQPRYPWCQKSGSELCIFENQILNMYGIGKELVRNGYLTPGDNWYTPKKVLANADTICFIQFGKQLTFVMSELSKKCQDFIKALPNYEKNKLFSQVDKIENSTDNIDDKIKDPLIPVVKQIQQATKDIDRDVKLARNFAQLAANRVEQLNSPISEINTTTTNMAKEVSAARTYAQSASSNSYQLIAPVDRIEAKISSTIIPVQDNIKTEVNKLGTEVTDLKPLIESTDLRVRDNTDTLAGIESNVKSTDKAVKMIETIQNEMRLIGRDTLALTLKIPKEGDGYKYVHTADYNSQGAFKYTLNNAQQEPTMKELLEAYVQVKQEEEQGEEQGLESYTTTRDNEGAAVTITDGNDVRSAAATVVSENAMNLQTVLRRYYPLFISPNIKNSNNFTIITVPVSPSFVPNDEDHIIQSTLNRRYDVHQLAWFSKLYTYFRGSLRYKIIVNTPNADIYVWHNPIDTKGFNLTSGFKPEHVTEQVNFATDLAVTRIQGGVEVEVPFYSTFNQLLHSHISSKNDLRSQIGTLYIAMRNRNEDSNVSIFASTGDDFMFNVLRAAPVIHEPFLEAYTNQDTGSSPSFPLSQYPELQRAMNHQSNIVQIPGTQVFDRWKDGALTNCEIPQFAPQDFNFTELAEESQQMEEQMFCASKIVGDLTGTTELKDAYYSDIKPLTVKTSELIDEFQTSLKDLKEFIIPQVLGHAKKLDQDINMTHNTIKGFLPKIEESMTHLNAFLVTGQQSQEAMKQCFEVGTGAAFYLEWLLKTVLIQSLWLNIIELHKKFTWSGLLNLICVSCCLFQQSVGPIIQWIYTNCRQFYEDYRSKATNGAREQGFEDCIADNADDLKIVLAAIATVIYCALFGGLPSWNKIKQVVKETVSGTEQGGGLADFLRTIHFSNLGIKAINNAFEFFQTWIEKIINWFLQREGKDVILEKQFKEKAEKIIKWIDEIAELEDEDFYHKALEDVDTHNRYYRLVDEGKEYTKWLMTEGVSKNVSGVIRDANKRLMEMVKRINAIRPGHGFRYAPFTIMLEGPSGCAKSNAMHKFTDMIREELDIPYYHSKYAVPKTEKFLDGYEGQTIIEWDDMLQSPNQDEMIGDFINWRSNADCIINKAKVEEKGTYFSSKAIIMSTNNGDVTLKTIRCMNAFRNRINIKFLCSLAPGITTDQLKTMQHDDEYSFMRLAAYEVQQEGASYRLIRENLTLEQAILFARRRFIAWNEKQNELVSNYMLQHGSLRIPKGVNITEFTEEEIDDLVEEYHIAEGMMTEEDHQFERGEELLAGVEQIRVTRYDISRNDSIILTEDEELDAEQFEIEFERLSESEKAKLFNRFKLQVNKINVKAKRYWEILKLKVQNCYKVLIEKAKDFYKKYPTFTKAMGILSIFGMAAYLLRHTIQVTEALTEDQYNTHTPKTSPKLVKAESTYNTTTPKVSPKLTKAEGIYSHNTPKVKTTLVRAEAIEEGTDDEQAIDMARNRIHPLMTIVGWKKADTTMMLQCLPIGGKVILVPHHFFRRANEGDVFFFMRGADEIHVEFTHKRMYRIKDKDACLYYVGPTFDSRKNIVNCFMQEKHLSLLGNRASAVLIGVLPSGTMTEKACTAVGNKTLRYTGKDEGAPMYVQYGWEYAVNTQAGECGSPLIICSKAVPPPGKIAGIHTAGLAASKGGFSILITREMIEETLVRLVADHGSQVTGMSLPVQVVQDEQMFMEKVKIVPEGSFSIYGVMDSKFCPSQPMQTALVPTPFQGELYPVKKKPAMLTSKNGISPLRNALGKYGKLTSPFKIKHIKAVKEDIKNEILMLKGDLKAEPCDLTTSIFGRDGVPYCEKLNMNSSPGWPYQCLPNARTQKGKRYLFDEDKKIITDALLKRNLGLREDMARNGERFASIWRDCLKDELRPIEKVDAGKTRLFTIAPVDFTILVRKYFLAFEQAFYKNHTKFFSAVGINPESFEWTQAYNRMRTYGTKCVAGDFSCYDGTLMADLMYEVGEIIDAWYKENGENDESATLIRRVLIDEMIHTYQLVQNCVYKTHQGNPSGNPLTVIINTIANVFYMRLAWMEIAEKEQPSMCNMHAYHQNVIEESYGDDNRLVIKEEVIGWFNQVTIAKALKEHSIIYTDELKSGELVEFRELETTSFLKRSFRRDEEIGKEIVLPIMDTDTIYSLTNWYRQADDEEEQLQANMKSALDFAFFHGREFYDEFSTKFCKKMREHDLKPISITYDEQLDRFLSIAHGDGKLKFMELF